MAQSSKICPVCLKPTRTASAGFATQFLGICRCKLETFKEPQVSALISICSICNKPISASRSGSLTQWIFRVNSCECANPVPLERSDAGSAGASLSAQAFVADIQCDDGNELPLQRENFPIERYKPKAQLGSGASGTVYLAVDRLLGKRVAVKLLRQLSGAQLISFQKEARTTSKLNHGNIIQILDFGPTESGLPYMVLEFVDNAVSLDHYIRAHGPLSWQAAIAIMAPVCDGLAYAHEHGILHRDIKPSNILLFGTESGALQSKIIDFGVAKMQEDMQEPSQAIDTNLTSIVGTPGYMAPEQASGMGYDVRSEIYSIGCVLFEILTGRSPFLGETAMQTLSMHAAGQIPRISELSDDQFPARLEELVSSCLATDKDARPESAGIVAERLRSIESVKPESSSLTTSMVMPGPGSVNSALPVVAALSVLAVGLAAVFFALSQMHGREGGDVPVHPLPAVTLENEPSLLPASSKLADGLGKCLLIENSRFDLIKPAQARGCTRIKIVDSHFSAADKLDGIASFTDLETLEILNCSGLNSSVCANLSDGLAKAAARRGVENPLWLDLTNSDIDDGGLVRLMAVRGLKVIVLQGTRISDAGLSKLVKVRSRLGNLLAIDISDTGITDDGINALKNLPPLVMVRASGCARVSKSALAQLRPRIVAASKTFERNQNFEMSILYTAAAQGSPTAQLQLAWLYKNTGPTQNLKESLNWLRKAAAQGNSQAESDIGYAYEHGLSVPADRKMAIAWYSKAASHGSVQAENNLGVLSHEMGDDEAAMRYLLSAANKGHASAMRSVGALYQGGFGVKQDYDRAFEWYKKAAGAGCSDAMYDIGFFYQTGKSVPVNFAEAIKWFIHAAEHNDRRAQTALGQIYENGWGVTRNYTKAMEWYLKAAANQSLRAEVLIGRLYYFGRGVNRDENAAMKWFREAAEQGDPDGAFNVGFMYLSGYHGKRDYEEGAGWLKKAAAARHGQAEYQLGKLYEQGLGVEINRSEAVRLYRQALSHGYPPAKKALQEAVKGKKGR